MEEINLNGDYILSLSITDSNGQPVSEEFLQVVKDFIADKFKEHNSTNEQ